MTNSKHDGRRKAAIQFGQFGDYKAFEFYEGKFSDRFVKACPGKIVVDCGMCYGYYTALALRAKCDRVWGFEPNDELHGPHLREAFGKNLNVFLNKSALGGEQGVITLVTRPNTLRSWAATKAIALARGNPKHTETKLVKVSCTTIDASAPGRVDIIKCDTEGGEATIFHGATRVLQEHKPIIFLELHRKGIGKAAIVELERLLRLYGYVPDFLKSDRNRFVLEAKK